MIDLLEMQQDLLDTKKEIQDLSDEYQVLSRNLVKNKVRIYLVKGHISIREEFCLKLENLIKERINNDRP